MSDTNERADRIEALENEISALTRRLRDAKIELLELQCEGAPRYEAGTVVLVPRMLFGKRRLWTAKIAAVHSQYSGRDPIVSYSVFLKQHDGDFGGSSVGFYHREVQLMSEGAEASPCAEEDAYKGEVEDPEEES